MTSSMMITCMDKSELLALPADLALFARLVGRNMRFSSRLENMYARWCLPAAGTAEDFAAAAPYFEAVRTDVGRPTEALRRASCVLAQGAALQQDVDTLLRVAAPELVGSPPSEICCSLGDYYLATGHMQTAADWYAAALSGAAPELIAASVGSLPMRGLAACLEAIGDLESQRLPPASHCVGEQNLKSGS